MDFTHLILFGIDFGNLRGESAELARLGSIANIDRRNAESLPVNKLGEFCVVRVGGSNVGVAISCSLDDGAVVFFCVGDGTKKARQNTVSIKLEHL